MVELLRDVAAQLQMLLLILTHRDTCVALVGQDIGCHQVWIDEQPHRGILAVLAGLLLELGHAVQPAQPRHAVEDPGQLGVRRNLALVEDDRLLRVDTGCDIGCSDFPRGVSQLGRVLPDRDRVHVDNAVDAFVIVLQTHEVADGAEIVAKREVPWTAERRKRCGPWA